MLFLRCVVVYILVFSLDIYSFTTGGLTGPSIVLYNISDSKQIRSRDSQQELVNMLENSYRLRGRRGGVKTKLDEARKRHNIPVHYTSCTNMFKFEYSNSNIKELTFRI